MAVWHYVRKEDTYGQSPHDQDDAESPHHPVQGRQDPRGQARHHVPGHRDRGRHQVPQGGQVTMKRDRGTGRIFQARYKDKDGNVQTCSTWSIKYYAGGKARKESGFETRAAAQKVLTSRLAMANTGVVPTASKATFEDLIGLVKNHYAANGKKSWDRVVCGVKHLDKVFRGVPARG